MQTLDVIRLHKSEFEIVAISAHKNRDLFLQQIEEFSPKFAVLSGYDKLDSNLENTSILFGEQGLDEIVDNCDYDYVVIALVGMIGLKYVLKALNRGKRVLLANKEALVAGGNIVIESCKKVAIESEKNSRYVPNATYADGIDLPSPLNRILPIDSEHSAIFQCMNTSSQNPIDKIFLTCSGGPFRTWSSEDIKNATKKQALKHPNWNMGAKISIDSATLFNKALEIIEASYLFGVPEDKIEVLIHPESVVHSMVGFKDKSIIAQLGVPSMKLPIQYSLSYPKRIESDIEYPILSKLNFEEPRKDVFKALDLARESLRNHDASCIVLNAANEVAVSYFLNDRIHFGNIYDCVDHTLNNIEKLYAYSYEDALYADNRARQIAKEFLEEII